MYEEQEFRATVSFLDKVWNDLSQKMAKADRDEFEFLMKQRVAIRKAQLIIEEIFYEDQE